MATPIEDYAVLGDTGDRRPRQPAGSIDWLCLPRFDSHACFAALLGTPEHGRWLHRPRRPGRRDHPALPRATRSSSRPSTRPTPAPCRVTDLMPLARRPGRRLRRVEGLRGHGPDAATSGSCGSTTAGSGPWVSRTPTVPRRTHRRVITRHRRTRHARPARHPAPPRRRTATTSTSSTSPPARRFTFSTTWFPATTPIPPPLDVRRPHRARPCGPRTPGRPQRLRRALRATPSLAPCSPCGC